MSNFREWSNPKNWDGDDGPPGSGGWRVYRPGEDSRFDRALEYLAENCGFRSRPVFVDSETIDLFIDHLERQIPVVFEEKDKLFLHSVGVCGD